MFRLGLAVKYGFPRSVLRIKGMDVLNNSDFVVEFAAWVQHQSDKTRFRFYFSLMLPLAKLIKFVWY